MKKSVPKQLGIGTFFTPLRWAKWLLLEYHIFDAWVGGATILDPTAGNGKFLEAFISLAKDRKILVNDRMIERLYGIEKEGFFISEFLSKVKRKYQIDFPKTNFINADIILRNPGVKADILVGNPPWMNFADLPKDYKIKIKPYFYEYGLVDNPQKLLLGSSRIDIAALILSIVLSDNLKKHGNAHFFLPLSIFLNDGAHSGFRRYHLKGTDFAISSIYDFDGHVIFKDVSTRYGVVHFRRDVQNKFPILYKIKKHNLWITNYAQPIHEDTSPLSIFQNKKQLLSPSDLPTIEIKADRQPRQGVNTCGANDIFIFQVDKIPPGLPPQFLFPLVSKENFFETEPIPKRFILLPYEQITGRPLTKIELEKYTALWQYLQKHKNKLINRKGTLINTWIKKNIWWALLGVGKYSFAPYKIFWNAFGQKNFSPKLFSLYQGKSWQGNQSLHAYIPLSSMSEAEKILIQLNNPLIEKYLLSFRMEGTCNWAQPGKMKKLFNTLSPQLSLRL